MKKAKAILIALFFAANLLTTLTLQLYNEEIISNNETKAAISIAYGEQKAKFFWKEMRFRYFCTFTNDKYCVIIL